MIDRPLLQMPTRAWGLFVASLLVGYVAFRTGVDFSARWIWFRPEYGHGLIIPFVTLFLIWQRRDRLERLSFTGSWWGVALLLLAVAINLLGKLSALYVIQQYSAVVALYGLVLALLGGPAFRVIWMPMLLLLFMIPFPEFVLQNVSAQLQLISSAIGVWFIRLAGISVYLEGNVIDLGVYQLQVAEACDGLRYLFPLMTLGFIMAYFFSAPFWKRALLFLSSIPLTILMNSVRIGIIGVTVQHWGIGMAEGFLHQFQGWVIFMACAALLLGEMILLTRFGAHRRPWREVFSLELPAPSPRGVTGVPRPLPSTFLVAFVILVAAAAVSWWIPERAELVAERRSFAEFPGNVPGWNVHRQVLEPVYQETLKLDDYLLADLDDRVGPPVNLYVAWYDSQ
ncbi:MAG: VPLPA-CTERM-specific exosortase XrtD, partial [Nitrospira sp.]